MKSDPNRPHRIENVDDDEEVFFLDEGWWDSVLSEEGVNNPPREDMHKANAKPCDNVDWKLVRGFHDRDEIVSLRVHGFNRGGLLVIGEGVQGFVPITHLVNLSV
jgi:small subunit ribosomal protein S1